MRGAVPQGSIPKGKTHDGFRYTISAMADQRQPAVRDEEELRLLAIAEACHSEEIAASDLLTNPHQSLIYPEYQRLIEELRAKRLKGHQSRIALKAHRYRKGAVKPPAL